MFHLSHVIPPVCPSAFKSYWVTETMPSRKLRSDGHTRKRKISECGFQKPKKEMVSTLLLIADSE